MKRRGLSSFAADAAFWRRLAYVGARHGPRPWLTYSPPVFGVACAALMPSARRAVRRNLRAVLGPRAAWVEHLDVARTFASYAGCLAEALAAERPEARSAQRRFREGDTLRQRLAAPEGLVVVTGHVGAWDAAAPLLARDLGRDVMVVMRKEPDAAARVLHDGVRERAGVRVVHVGDHPLDALPLLRHLGRGGIVAAQLDRTPPGTRQLEVELFGRPFRVPEGPFTLAALAGVAVLPVFVRRLGHFDYEFSGGEPIVLPRRPSPAELAAAARAAVREMERFVLQAPTQWFHFDAA